MRACQSGEPMDKFDGIILQDTLKVQRQCTDSKPLLKATLPTENLILPPNKLRTISTICAEKRDARPMSAKRRERE
eukprot:7836087-Pyramimonas_sp.AAC.1